MCVQGWIQMTRRPTYTSPLAAFSAVRGTKGKVECGEFLLPDPPHVVWHCRTLQLCQSIGISGLLMGRDGGWFRVYGQTSGRELKCCILHRLVQKSQ
jgi:hypothetical protein